NLRVKEGDLLVQLDEKPYQIQVAIKQAALEVAETDLAAAQAQVRAMVAQVRSSRFKLEHAMEEVRNQLALLASNVAQRKVADTNLALAERDYTRSKALLEKGTIT